MAQTKSKPKSRSSKNKSQSKFKKLVIGRSSRFYLVGILFVLAFAAFGTWQLGNSSAGTSALSAMDCHLRGREYASRENFCTSNCSPGAGPWIKNVDQYGFCDNAISQTIGQSKCDSLGRKFVGAIGCARRWQQTTVTGAIQCQSGAVAYHVASPYDYCGSSSGSGWQWPVADSMNQGPSMCWNAVYGGRHHAGLDINVPNGSHTAVFAAAAGTVTTRSYDSGGGNHIIIKHGTGLYSVYEHLSSWSVSVGQHVNKGQVIGHTGISGNSTGEHLHFGVTVDGTEGEYTYAPQPNSSSRTRNPLNYLPHKASYAACY